jgi:hypothetical protein
MADPEEQAELLKALIARNDADGIPPVFCDVMCATIFSAYTEEERLKFVAIHHLLDCDCGAIPEHPAYVISFAIDPQTAYELGLTLMAHAERIGYDPHDFGPEDITGAG